MVNFRGHHDHIKITQWLVILVNLGVIMTSHYCVQQVPTCAWLDFWHNGHTAGKVGMKSKWQGQFFNAPFISTFLHFGLWELDSLHLYYSLYHKSLWLFLVSANIVYLACHFNHCTFMCRISCNKSSYEDLANSLPYSWIH